MNGGIYVVLTKDAMYHHVEKVFTENIDMAINEIKMAHRVKHGALTLFTEGYISPDWGDASLWVEFCDRGSLEDIMKVYIKHRGDKPTPRIPEAFVWQSLNSLTDALYYLETGKSFFDTHQPDPNWIPILHRDIKPDNVFLRSRSGAAGAEERRYYYCVLSDFGLACEDWPDGHPKQDHIQRGWQKTGTMQYFAPELCQDPYTQTRVQDSYFTRGYRHSKRSDLWAVAATISNLCCAVILGNTRSHFTKDAITPDGVIYRERRLPIPRSVYSHELLAAVRIAGEWEITQRPSPRQFIPELHKLARRSGRCGKAAYEPLPDWATRPHDYHSLPTLPSSA
jgi:serine/threonine protein kinase